jgi:DNA-binding NarL/FixJ family response regulator
MLGETNQQIAQKLGFSHQTIRNYVKNIYIKIGVHNRAALFVQMYQQI